MNESNERERLTLDALASDPARASDLSVEDIAGVLARLTPLQTALSNQLAIKLLNAQPPPSEDRMLTIEQAAERIHESPDWLKRHARRLPFVKHISRKRWLVSETALNRWVARKG